MARDALPASSMPLSCGTNAGCESLVASSKLRNCEGANGSCRSRVFVSTAPETEKANWLASLGAWLPTLSIFRSRGMARWLTCNVPAGCSTNPASVGSSCRSTTSSLRFGGNAVFQFEAFCGLGGQDRHDLRPAGAWCWDCRPR